MELKLKPAAEKKAEKEVKKAEKEAKEAEKAAQKEAKKAAKAEEKKQQAEAWAKEREETKKKEKKLGEYDYRISFSLDKDDKDFLERVEEYEAVRNADYSSAEDEKLELLRLIAKQNLLILGELKKINYNVRELE